MLVNKEPPKEKTATPAPGRDYRPDSRDLLILDRLGNACEPVSGQKLADELGMSRVALWKRIERLKACAYHIEVDHSGYRLRDEDAVGAWVFRDGPEVRYLAETGSTMDEAWQLAENGALAGTMVIAEKQSAGRGQHGRSWISPGGGLYLTLVLKPHLPSSYVGSLVLEGAAVVAEYLETQCGLSLDFHWPNDLAYRGVKVGGLLAELAGTPESPRFFTLGLGLNLHDVGLENRRTAGLADLLTHAPRRRDLARMFRDRLVAWSAQPEFRTTAWESRYPSRGKPLVMSDWRGVEVRGTPVGFSRQGAIRLCLNDGSIGEWAVGEAHSVRPYIGVIA